MLNTRENIKERNQAHQEISNNQEIKNNQQKKKIYQITSKTTSITDKEKQNNHTVGLTPTIVLRLSLIAAMDPPDRTVNVFEIFRCLRA
jgi:hypothetical protein